VEILDKFYYIYYEEFPFLIFLEILHVTLKLSKKTPNYCYHSYSLVEAYTIEDNLYLISL